MGRRLGQHFLNDTGILDRIVDALDPQPSDVVIEIGPGKGSLTRRLAPRVGQVIAIEKDRLLATELGTRNAEVGTNVTILLGDALAEDFGHVTSAFRVPRSDFKIVGNIPYQITSPLIEKALSPPLPSVIVMLVQKEVADRLVAEPGADDYGGLTVGVRAVARVERLFVVRAGAFSPPPKVDSAVVRFVPLAEPLVTDAERHGFREFVTALFSQRRKQLGRSLRAAAALDRDAAAMLLRREGIPPSDRVEVLAPDRLVRLFRASRGSRTL